MALLVNYTDLDVDVHVQDAMAPAHVQMPQGLEVVLPPLPAGLHRISVSINGFHVRSQGWGGCWPFIVGLFDGLVIQSRNSGFELGVHFPPFSEVR